MKLKDGVVMTETDYGAVLLDEVGGEYWALNATGSIIVGKILAGSGQDAVAGLLAEKYSVTAERARTDVAVLLRDLTNRGLIV